MDIRDLSREELVPLKIAYLVQLANEGLFSEIVGVDYDYPSYGDIENADEIVPDDVIFDFYSDVDFCEEDLACSGALPGIDF